MAIYVGLGKATDEGIKQLAGLAERVQKAEKEAEAMGCKFLARYALTGQYDYLIIIEAPNEKTALKFMVARARVGTIRMETYPAIPIEEFAKLF